MPQLPRIFRFVFTSIVAGSCTVWLIAGLTGCVTRGSPEPSPQTVNDSSRAEQLALEAGGMLVANPVEAEKMLQEALQLDPFCGIAHNNLGSIYLQGRPPRGEPDLFAAAESFQTAAKLLPGRADPRMNMGMVMERAGRLDDALAAYNSAVECSARHMPSVQALTSLEIRVSKISEQTRERLKLIALQGTDPAWRAWAKDQLLRSRKP